jgi:V/A-type H+-transporting ATPase subunit E
MGGIDFVISKIEAEGTALSKSAAAQAQEQLLAVRRECDELCAALEEQFERELAQKKSRAAAAAKSSAQAQAGRLLLQTKNEALDEALSHALAVLEGMEGEEYFAALKGIALREALEGKGEMLLSVGDEKSLPKGFAVELNAALGDKGSLELKPSERVSGKGFLLVYGNIEVNCLFGAIAQEKRDELRQTLAKILFE